MLTKHKTTVEVQSEKRIDQLIALVRGHVKSFNDTVQEAAVAIIEHASNYGDCSRAKILGRAVPSRLRPMLIGYFKLYSPIAVNIHKSDARKDTNRFMTDEALRAFRERARLMGADENVVDTSKWPKFYLEGAKANKWYEDPARVSPEPTYEGLKEFWDKVDGFFERLLKQTEPADGKPGKYLDNDLPAIKQAIHELQARVNRYHAKQMAELAANEPGPAPTDEDEGAPAPSASNVVQGPKPRRGNAPVATRRRARRGKAA